LFYFSGITLINVAALNLLKIAPGGHVGRFYTGLAESMLFSSPDP
jgi:hypothetical protein